MAELVAAIQRWESRPIQGDASSPGHFNTVPRPGQPGEQNEYRAGPNPRSGHPTGPHPPYEPDDPEGTAAEKHHGKPAPLERKGARAQPSEGGDHVRPGTGVVVQASASGRLDVAFIDSSVVRAAP